MNNQEKRALYRDIYVQTVASLVSNISLSAAPDRVASMADAIAAQGVEFWLARVAKEDEAIAAANIAAAHSAQQLSQIPPVRSQPVGQPIPGRLVTPLSKAPSPTKRHVLVRVMDGTPRKKS